ncbi:hypothetical protein DFP72DRAFT_1060314 [Ephemerocybe angulata]|uniref:Uncharacterized protein n=1 Tax=Ephemerocybe angulata TaxID=980116 RepID=A0A8H6IDM0_9AGAR|nr:hypothetical protein DFP72DRAFT_1060314 [Tulosesus angulatus]
MPLFKSNSTRRASASPVRDSNTTTNSRSGGLFSRDSRSSYDSGSSRSSIGGSGTRNGGGGFLGLGKNKNHLDNDPSIISARQKIADAERAERDADMALRQARQAVDNAKDQVRMLEREAVEDSKRAKAKQAEAKIINKTAKHLGRH